MLNCVVLRKNLIRIYRSIYKIDGKKKEGVKRISYYKGMKMFIVCLGKGKENDFIVECVGAKSF